MNGRRLAVVLVLTAVMGCSAQHGSEATHGGSNDGTVHGSLVRVGGPDPGSMRPLSGTISLAGTAEETLPVGSDGRFSGSLPAGTYHVSGFTSDDGSGSYSCQARRDITVAADQSTKADIYCQVR